MGLITARACEIGSGEQTQGTPGHVARVPLVIQKPNKAKEQKIVIKNLKSLFKNEKNKQKPKIIITSHELCSLS